MLADAGQQLLVLGRADEGGKSTGGGEGGVGDSIVVINFDVQEAVVFVSEAGCGSLPAGDYGRRSRSGGDQILVVIHDICDRTGECDVSIGTETNPGNVEVISDTCLQWRDLIAVAKDRLKLAGESHEDGAAIGVGYGRSGEIRIYRHRTILKQAPKTGPEESAGGEARDLIALAGQWGEIGKFAGKGSVII